MILAFFYFNLQGPVFWWYTCARSGNLLPHYVKVNKTCAINKQVNKTIIRLDLWMCASFERVTYACRVRGFVSCGCRVCSSGSSKYFTRCCQLELFVKMVVYCQPRVSKSPLTREGGPLKVLSQRPDKCCPSSSWYLVLSRVFAFSVIRMLWWVECCRLESHPERSVYRIVQTVLKTFAFSLVEGCI